MNKQELITKRQAVAADVPFILATWLRGLRFGNSWFKLIDNQIYYQVYHNVLVRLLSTPGVKVDVACLKDDQEVILGYCAYRDDVLHWVHVKKAWRKIGIAKSLVPTSTRTVTHLSDVGKSIFFKQKRWVFNPFLTA